MTTPVRNDKALKKEHTQVRTDTQTCRFTVSGVVSSAGGVGSVEKEMLGVTLWLGEVD